MIWIVLVAAAEVPDLPDDGETMEWAKSQIDTSLQRYEVSLSGDKTSAAEEDRYRYVDLAGYAAKPTEDYVDFALSDDGKRIFSLICAKHPSCLPTATVSAELASIRSQLDRQLADAHSERQHILLKTLLISLLPPIIALLSGLGISRLRPMR